MIWGRRVGKISLTKNGTEKGLSDKMIDVKWRLFDLFIHDLTGPLSIASTSADSLLSKVDRYGPLTEHQKRVLDRVSRNIRRAKSLNHEMIEILRSEERVF